MKLVSLLYYIEGIVHDPGQGRDIGVKFDLLLDFLSVFVSGEQF